MALIGVSTKVLTAKLIVFFVILFVDIFLSSFIELNISSKLSSKPAKSIMYALFTFQLSSTGLLLCSFFVMMWSTFLLRFGLLGIIFNNFKVTILTMILYLLAFLAERFYLFFLCYQEINTCDDKAWKDGLYIFFYYCRFLIIIPFYTLLSYSAIRLATPEYYKPNKWLKN